MPLNTVFGWVSWLKGKKNKKVSEIHHTITWQSFKTTNFKIRFIKTQMLQSITFHEQYYSIEANMIQFTVYFNSSPKEFN